MSLTVNRLVRRKLRLSLVLLVAYAGASASCWLLYPSFSPDVAAELARDSKPGARRGAHQRRRSLVAINPLRHDRVPDRFPGDPPGLHRHRLWCWSRRRSSATSCSRRRRSARSCSASRCRTRWATRSPAWRSRARSRSTSATGSGSASSRGASRKSPGARRSCGRRAGNFVVLPNNIVSKEAITNYSEPDAPTRLEVEVGAGYQVAAERGEGRDPRGAAQLVARAARRRRRRRAACVRCDRRSPTRPGSGSTTTSATTRPATRCGRRSTTPSSATASRFRGRSRSSTRRTVPAQDLSAHARAGARCWPAVDLFAPLSAELRQELAASTPLTVYGSGETIVRPGRGRPVDVRRLLRRGSASCSNPARQEVARIERGGYFGEMSLLTGEPRSATVLAVGDVIGRRDRRRALPAPGGGESAGDREDRHGRDGAPRRPRAHQDRHGRRRDGRDEDVARADEEVPADSAAIQADAPASRVPVVSASVPPSSRYARSYPSGTRCGTDPRRLPSNRTDRRSGGRPSDTISAGHSRDTCRPARRRAPSGSRRSRRSGTRNSEPYTDPLPYPRFAPG